MSQDTNPTMEGKPYCVNPADPKPVTGECFMKCVPITNLNKYKKGKKGKRPTTDEIASKISNEVCRMKNERMDQSKLVYLREGDNCCSAADSRLHSHRNGQCSKPGRNVFCTPRTVAAKKSITVKRSTTNVLDHADCGNPYCDEDGYYDGAKCKKRLPISAADEAKLDQDPSLKSDLCTRAGKKNSPKRFDFLNLIKCLNDDNGMSTYALCEHRKDPTKPNDHHKSKVVSSVMTYKPLGPSVNSLITSQTTQQMKRIEEAQRKQRIMNNYNNGQIINNNNGQMMSGNNGRDQNGKNTNKGGNAKPNGGNAMQEYFSMYPLQNVFDYMFITCICLEN